MDEWVEVGKELRRDKVIRILSPRELQVFILSGRGKTPKESAIILEVSPKTIDSYRTSTLRKLDLENIYGVMRYCIRADMDTDEFMNKYI